MTKSAFNRLNEWMGTSKAHLYLILLCILIFIFWKAPWRGEPVEITSMVVRYQDHPIKGPALTLKLTGEIRRVCPSNVQVFIRELGDGADERIFQETDRVVGNVGPLATQPPVRLPLEHKLEPGQYALWFESVRRCNDGDWPYRSPVVTFNVP